MLFRTTPGEDPHWSTVWLVVLDGQVYVRLGSRAFGRVEQNQDGHTVAVRIGGEEVFGAVTRRLIQGYTALVGTDFVGQYRRHL